MINNVTLVSGIPGGAKNITDIIMTNISSRNSLMFAVCNIYDTIRMNVTQMHTSVPYIVFDFKIDNDFRRSYLSMEIDDENGLHYVYLDNTHTVRLDSFNHVYELINLINQEKS